MIGVQNVIRRELQIRKQMNVAQISCRQPKVRIFLMIHQQDLPIEAELRQRLGKRLGLMALERKCIDHIQLIVFEFLTESRLQSSSKHLLRQGSLVIPRTRPKDRTALPPQRIPNLTNPGATCTLLAPRLPAAPGNLSACLRVMRPGSKAGEVLFYCQMHQTGVNRSGKDCVGEVQLPCDIVVQILDMYRCHWYRPHVSTTR